MNPKVTVGLPFYNNQDALGDAIRSVLNQTYQNFELLIVNDGSTDNSLAVVQSFDDPRIRLVDDNINKGLPARLNHITELTETEFLFRMDADDVIHPKRIEIQMERLLMDPELDLVSSRMWVISPDGDVLGQQKSSGDGNIKSRDVLLRKSGIAHATVGGRTKWFRENPYRADLKRAQDWELWVRTMDRTKHVRMPQALYFYRVSETQKMESYRINRRVHRKVIREYGSDLVGKRSAYLHIGRLYVEELIMAVAVLTGRSSQLLKRRYTAVSDEERAQAKKDLAEAVLEQ